MSEDQVLILSFWNPTEQLPHQGIFIQEQAAAVCRMRENVIFFQVNIQHSKNLFPRKTIEESEFYRGTRIRLDLSTFLWKFLYLNPWTVTSVIYRYIRRRQGVIHPSVIHANIVFPCGVSGLLLSERLNSRLIISEHWSRTGRILRHPLFGAVSRKAYMKSHAVICVSEFLSTRISGSTGHKNILIIPNIIDTGLFDFRQKQSRDGGVLRLLCAASWRLPKRLDLIFESVCSLAGGQNGNLELTIAGSGEQAEKLKQRNIPANLTVNWTGYTDRKMISELMQKAHFFLHASETETFSMVTAEALATGTPVLASDTGALPELINERNGVLVKNTTEDWIAGLRAIIAGNYDNEAISKENQDRFSEKSVGKSIISLYRLTGDSRK